MINSALPILKTSNFRAIADAHGESFFRYHVTNGANATSSEEFPLRCLPSTTTHRERENFIERVISTEDLVEGDGGAFEAVSLGLGDTDDFQLNFGSGDPNKDPGCSSMLKPCVTPLNNCQILNLAPCNSMGVDVARRCNELSSGTDQTTLSASSHRHRHREPSQRVDSIQIAIRDDGIIPTGGSAAMF